jgi:phosphoribosylanthranilate isomerase
VNIKIKVCGMRDPGNIREIASLKPDYMGFIFHERSARFVGHAFDLSWFDFPIKKVGVFYDLPLKDAVGFISQHDFEIAQLHGSEEPEYCRKLKEQFPDLIIWKAFAVGPMLELNKLNEYKDEADAYIFDTQTITGGGSGTSFNWNLLKDYDNHKSLILAGGIGPENIDDALSLIESGLRIEVLDINSKAEISPGLKSKKILEEMLLKIRPKIQ